MSHILQWPCLEGVGEEDQEQVTPYHRFEAAVTFNCCLCCFPGGGGAVRALIESCCHLQLLGRSMNPVHGWVLWVLENNFLTKCASQFSSSSPNIQTSSMVISINPIQRLKRSDQMLNRCLQLGWWLEVIEQWWAVWLWANYLTSLSLSFLSFFFFL